MLSQVVFCVILSVLILGSCAGFGKSVEDKNFVGVALWGMLFALFLIALIRVVG